MRHSKLYSILQYFNKYEQNRLRKFLQSPYFNKNQRLTTLFDYLIKKTNTQSEKGLAKEQIWKQLYEDKGFDDVRYRKLISELLKLVETFLAQEHFQENPLYQATYLLEAVGRRKMDELYKGAMRTARRLSDQQSYKPGDYYFYQYQVEKSYQELTEHEHDRESKRNYENILKNLDVFYISEKLKYYISILSHQLVSSQKYEVLFIDQLIEYVKSYNYEEFPTITVYFQMCLAQIEFDDESHFFKLKELIKHYIDVFPQNEAKQIYSFASNYCITKVNRGNTKFLKEYFNLYRELIQKEMIYTDGELSPWVFKNIVGVATRLGEYEWAKKFIFSYNEKIPFDFRENAVTFNLSMVYFYQKEFEKVIKTLHQVEYQDFSYNLNSKMILMMTYYELNEIEPLYSLMESFRTYLNRHKDFPALRRELYLNLIRYTKKMSKLIPKDHNNINKLKAELDIKKNIAGLSWLKEKIAELE